MFSRVELAVAAIRKSYGDTLGLWGAYWRLYGGVTAVASSLYFAISLTLTLICFKLWVQAGWWETVISAVPTMLGFTLAGLAVFLGMDSKFSTVIAGGKADDPSPFLVMISSFVHFVVVQVLALAYALIAKATFFIVDDMPAWYYQVIVLGRLVAWFFGFLLFIYAVFSMLAATFAIFTASRWFDEFSAHLSEDEEGRKSDGRADE